MPILVGKNQNVAQSCPGFTSQVSRAAGVPGVKPVVIELTDFHTKEKVDELEVDAVMVATGRAPFTQVGFPAKFGIC